jgi:integrase
MLTFASLAQSSAVRSGPLKTRLAGCVPVAPLHVPASLLLFDATGERGELEALRWKDVDEPEQRWRVSQSVAKTRRARWVEVSPVLLRGCVRACGA